MAEVVSGGSMEGTTGSHENGGPPKAPSPSTLPLKAALPTDSLDERKASPATADDALAALVSLSSRPLPGTSDSSPAAPDAPPATPTKDSGRESVKPTVGPSFDDPVSGTLSATPDPAIAISPAASSSPHVNGEAPLQPDLPSTAADAHPTTQPPSSASASGPADATPMTASEPRLSSQRDENDYAIRMEGGVGEADEGGNKDVVMATGEDGAETSVKTGNGEAVEAPVAADEATGREGRPEDTSAASDRKCERLDVSEQEAANGEIANSEPPLAALNPIPSASDQSAATFSESGSEETTSPTADPPSTHVPPAPTPAPIDLPCMRGELRVEADGSHVVTGHWGMTAAAHGVDGQTSPFELRLAPPRAGQVPHPSRCSGVYAGFFMLMQGAGKPPLKVEEKMVHLTYISNSEGGHNVQGSGKNRFGQFVVTGSVDADGAVNLFRSYVPKPKPERTKTDGRKRGPGVGRGGGGAASRPRTGGPRGENLTINASLARKAADELSASTPASISTAPSSPRGLGGKTIQALSESSSAGSSSPVDSASPGGRSKRSTAGDWKSKADIPSNREPAPERAPGQVRSAATGNRKGKGKEHALPIGSGNGSGGSGSPLGPGPLDGVDLPNSVADAGQSKSGRVRRIPTHLQDTDEKEKVRLNEHMRKCLTVLRDVGKQPNAHWFAVPLDWSSLGLLDYPKIITQPMDFTTIKGRIETGSLTSPDEFKESMLLVFRNAVTYNVKKDNLVHVAALAVKAVFEDKFRAVIEPLGPMSVKEEASVASSVAAAAAAAPPATGSGSGRGGRKAQGSRGGAARGPGRAKNAARDAPPGSVGGMVPQEHFVALQQQMEMMQQQLETLRRQTSQTEANMQAQMQLGQLGGGKGVGGGNARKSKAVGDVRPFSEEEKEALKQGISSLPSEKLPRVVEIIKERMSVDERDQEIEIDLDALDPSTLHHLQRYVKSCTSRKRKKVVAARQAPDSPAMLQHLPSPGLPDLDIDINALEADVLGMHEDDTSDPKRNRVSLDAMVLDSGNMFGQVGLPEALESDS